MSHLARSNVLPTSWVEKIFFHLEMVFGERFLGIQYDDKKDHEMVKQYWAEFLGDLSESELKAGVGQLKTLKFTPNLAQFRALCKESSQLDYETAFNEAVNQSRERFYDGSDHWSSPAIYWAQSRIGNDLRVTPYHLIKNRWKTELDRAIAEIKAGVLPNEVPPKRVALPKSPQTRPEEAKKRIAEIQAMLRSKMAGGLIHV